MRNLAALLCFLAFVCGGNRGGTLAAASVMDRSSTGLPQSTSTPAPQVISVGEVVTAAVPIETSGVNDKLFELTAPVDGTLVAELNWDPSWDALSLYLEDAGFHYWPPAVGALQVVAGQTIRVRVSIYIDPWGYSWDFPSEMPFVLTTAILPGLADVPLGCPYWSAYHYGPPVPGWVCVDGGWVPPDHPLALGGAPPLPPPPGDATDCLTRQPVANWLCVKGNWVPPDHPLAIANPPVSPSPPLAPAPPVVGPVGCSTVRPAATWVCVDGGWVPPDHPLAAKAATQPTVPAQPAPPPTGCTTPDPFSGIPGLVGVCVGGNWIPIGHPLAGGGWD
jgi:hypothetical protein